MTSIAIDLLVSHPANANRMSEALFDKLVEHIRANRRYPAVIVRPHPIEAGRYEILDGHHRVLALRRLRRRKVDCDVWKVDDSQADLLLLTLNRLRGEDDPQRRADLLQRLMKNMDVAALAAKLPEDAARIGKLLALLEKPGPLVAPPVLGDMPHAVTFFLNARQRRTLFEKLRAIAADRSEALVVAMGLEGGE